MLLKRLKAFGAQPSWLWGRRAFCPPPDGLAAASLPDHGLAGETPASPTGWKPVPPQRSGYRCKSKRGVRQLPDTALIELAIDCLFKAEARRTSQSLHWSSW